MNLSTRLFSVLLPMTLIVDGSCGTWISNPKNPLTGNGGTSSVSLTIQGERGETSLARGAIT